MDMESTRRIQSSGLISPSFDSGKRRFSFLKSRLSSIQGTGTATTARASRFLSCASFTTALAGSSTLFDQAYDENASDFIEEEYEDDGYGENGLLSFTHASRLGIGPHGGFSPGIKTEAEVRAELGQEKRQMLLGFRRARFGKIKSRVRERIRAIDTALDA